ncbi:MAG: FAD-dependent oxidoreductase [Pseudonocardiaceae bacterium]
MVDASSRVVRYDTLVYALGGAADVDAVPGAREHAFTVAEVDQALRLRAQLVGLATGRAIAVAGGGLTGIETATELAEAYPGLRIELACAGRVGGSLSARAERHLRRAFERMGIKVYEGSRIAKVGPNSLLLDDGRSLHADVIVWAAGLRVPAGSRGRASSRRAWPDDRR